MYMYIYIYICIYTYIHVYIERPGLHGRPPALHLGRGPLHAGVLAGRLGGYSTLVIV